MNKIHTFPIFFALALACSACATTGANDAKTRAQSHEAGAEKTHYRFRYLLQVNEAVAARFGQIADEMQQRLAETWPEAKPEVEHPSGSFSLRVSFDKPPSKSEFEEFIVRYFPSLRWPEKMAPTVQVDMSDEMLAKHREAVVAQTMASLNMRLQQTGLSPSEFEVEIRENYTLDVVVPRIEKAKLALLDSFLRVQPEFALRKVDDPNNEAFFKYLDLPEGATRRRIDGGYLTITHPDKSALVRFFDGKVPDDHVLAYKKTTETDDTGATETYWTTYYLWRDPVVSSQHLSDARAAIDERFNRPYVGITFNPEGTKRFAEFTRKNVGYRVAIMLDDRLYTAPVIQEEIPGGRIQVSFGTMKSFEELAKQAQSVTLVIRHGMIGTRLEKLSEGPVTLTR